MAVILDEELKRLEELEDYFLLLSATEETYKESVEILGDDLPKGLSQWLRKYNGGDLFGISMLSTKKEQKGVFNRLLTFREVNDKEFMESMDIHEDLRIFAETSYGNYYCFVTQENLEAVYEWDVEEQGLIVRWDNFGELLKEIIDNAIKDIEDGLLDKIDKKQIKKH